MTRRLANHSDEGLQADATTAGPVSETGDEADDDLERRSRGEQIQLYGYVWLFFAGGLLLIRLFADPTMVRRPLLEPNLSAGGLTFIGCSLFVFLTANVISRPVDNSIDRGSRAAVRQRLRRQRRPSWRAGRRARLRFVGESPEPCAQGAGNFRSLGHRDREWY